MKLTAKEFKDLVEGNPTWAKGLTTKVEVIDFCELDNSPIQCLSPHLHFKGKNKEGWSALFKNCQSLEGIEGVFDYAVNIDFCGIKFVRKTEIKNPNNYGWAGAFTNCRELARIEGNAPFPGAINISNSALEDTATINITRPNKDGTALIACGCRNLKEPKGKFPGLVNLSGSGTQNLQHLMVLKPSNKKSLKGVKLCVYDCLGLKKLPTKFNPEEVIAEDNLIKDLEEAHTKLKTIKKITEPSLTIDGIN